MFGCLILVDALALYPKSELLTTVYWYKPWWLMYCHTTSGKSLCACDFEFCSCWRMCVDDVGKSGKSVTTNMLLLMDRN